MASTSVQGNWAAQARVFGHDAISVALNSVSKVEVNAGGTGHAVGDIITLATVSCNVKVTEVNSGVVTNIMLVPNNTASGSQPYGKGGVVDTSYNQSATTGSGVGFSAFVRETNLPETDVRGASLYVANDLTELSVIMESGSLYATSGPAHTANFKGVKAGTFLPILVKKVVTWTSPAGADQDGEIIALY
tara:strand:- start:394 stop:963 length:570 start_codon:yes stop_codon:yes gene_type:complete